MLLSDLRAAKTFILLSDGQRKRTWVSYKHGLYAGVLFHLEENLFYFGVYMSVQGLMYTFSKYLLLFINIKGNTLLCSLSLYRLIRLINLSQDCIHVLVVVVLEEVLCFKQSVVNYFIDGGHLVPWYIKLTSQAMLAPSVVTMRMCFLVLL